MIGIVDYGMGNIHSVRKVVDSFGDKSIIVTSGAELKGVEKIILPGVGAFADAMHELEKRSLKAAIIEAVTENKPFLGICLGMQLLFDYSFEGEGADGLRLLAGKVNKFNQSAGLKVPHIGWNQISPVGSRCRLLNNIPLGSYVYFCHSYFVVPDDKGVVAATTDYGIDFSSAVCRDNLFGVQFHPEKSQTIGKKILENFVKLC